MALQKSHLRFKEIRLALGLGQIDFAAQARIKQSQVSQIETGTRDISDSIYAALQHHFSVNRAWLEKGEGDMFTADQQPAAAKTRDLDQKVQVQRLRSGLKNVNMATQAERLRFFREQEGISADQLAAELNVSKATLNKYENAKLYMPVEVPVYLHDKYHLNYDWFFNGSGPRKRSYAMRAMPQLSVEELYETQTVLIARIDHLEKQLKTEKNHRVKQQREINKLTLDKS